MRRSFALALISVTVLAGSLAYTIQGCGGGGGPVQDLCGWLGDPNNCYRRFADGVANPTSGTGPTCGVFVTLDPMGNPVYTQNGQDYTIENKKPTFGSFQKREELGTCILLGANGGQVVFDGLDINMLPPQTFTFTIKDGQGNVCGMGSYTGITNFSIGFPEPMVAGATSSSSSTGSGDTSTSVDTSPLYTGTFTMDEREPEIVDTTCPNGEAHKFNLFQLNKCDGTDPNEDNYVPILPTAELQVNAGTTTAEGYIKLYVYWPPPRPTDPAHDDLNGAKPTKVEYFDCKIPAAPNPCNDGEQDGLESDIDCGRGCALCGDMKFCLVNEDCISNVCTPDAMGLKKCVGGGTGGAGGTTTTSAGGTGGTAGTAGMGGVGGMSSSSSGP